MKRFLVFLFLFHSCIAIDPKSQDMDLEDDEVFKVTLKGFKSADLENKNIAYLTGVEYEDAYENEIFLGYCTSNPDEEYNIIKKGENITCALTINDYNTYIKLKLYIGKTDLKIEDRGIELNLSELNMNEKISGDNIRRIKEVIFFDDSSNLLKISGSFKFKEIRDLSIIF